MKIRKKNMIHGAPLTEIMHLLEIIEDLESKT